MSKYKKEKKKIGDICKQLRINKRFTRHELSDKSGKTQQTFYNFENGGCCRLDYILIYKDCLQLNDKEKDDFILSIASVLRG